MMTSINPKNVNINNIQSNERNIIPSTGNSLFQRNNFGIEKEGINDEIGNNIKFKTNSNINYNLNYNNDNQLKLNSLRNAKSPEIKNDNMIKNINNDYMQANTNINYPIRQLNKQNNQKEQYKDCHKKFT